MMEITAPTHAVSHSTTSRDFGDHGVGYEADARLCLLETDKVAS